MDLNLTKEYEPMDQIEKIPTITIFSKNDCFQCDSVKNRLNRDDVVYTEINVETDTAPRAEFGGLTPFDHVVKNYGRSMPVIVVEDGEWGDFWCGIRPDKTRALVTRIKILRQALESSTAQS